MFITHTYVYIGLSGRERLNSVAVHLVQPHVIHLIGKGAEEEQMILKWRLSQQRLSNHKALQWRKQKNTTFRILLLLVYTIPQHVELQRDVNVISIILCGSAWLRFNLD